MLNQDLRFSIETMALIVRDKLKLAVGSKGVHGQLIMVGVNYERERI